MQKKKILVKLIPVVFLLGVTWFFFFISQKTIQKPQNSLFSYIPQNTEWLIEINTRSILDRGIQSILFAENPDKELNNLIQNFVASEKFEGFSIENSGINLQHKIYLFGMKNGDKKYLCLLLKVDNEQKFKENLKDIPSKDFYSTTNNNVGLIIFGEGDDKNNLSKLIFNTENDSFKEGDFSFSFNYQTANFKTDVHTSILDSIILYQGNFQLEDEILSNKTALVPKDFHFTSRFVPQNISDSICSFFQINSNRLCGISVNHSSTELKSQPKITLNFNSTFLLHFEDSISIHELIEANIKENYQMDSLSFSLFDYTYFYHQLSPTTIYIGNTPFKQSMITQRDAIFYIKGNPSHLTAINGEGIARRFLNVIPVFTATETFANSIESIHLNSKTLSKNEYSLSGGIYFKNGKKSMNELLRFGLLMAE